MQFIRRCPRIACVKLVLGAAAITTILGCATLGQQYRPLTSQEIEILKPQLNSLYDQKLLVSSVGFKLLRSLPQEKMKKKSAYLPFLYFEVDPMMEQVYGMERGKVMVLGMVPEAVSSDLGIQRGDEVVSFQGVKITSEYQLNQLLEKNSSLREAKVGLQRGLREWEVNLPLFESRRMIYFGASDSSAIDTYAATNLIVVTKGMLGFLESRDELAFVLAHELAHLTEGHIGETVAYKLFSFASGVAVGALSESVASGTAPQVSRGFSAGMESGFSVPMEMEADRVGFDYAVRAGFRPEASVAIWRRFKEQIPKTDQYSFTMSHPTSGNRLEEMEKLAKQVVRKERLRKSRIQKVKTVPVPREDLNLPLGKAPEIDKAHKKEKVMKAVTTNRVEKKWHGGFVAEREVTSFPADTEKVIWAAEFKSKFSDTFDMNIPCRAEWHAPNGVLYHNESFDCSLFYIVTELEISHELGPSKIGRWRVKVWKEDHLVDERYFRIG